MVQILTLLTLLGYAIQVWGSSHSTKRSNCPTTLFDDLPQNLEGFSPYNDPVGTYEYIYYQGFNVVTQKYSNEKFFHIPSPPNVINANDITQGLFGGTAALIINTTALQNPTATFSLFSARLACLVTNGNSTSNYEGCTVLFVGNKPNKKKSVVYEYEYPNQNTNFTFGDGPLVDFGKVVLPNSFTGLKEVFLTLTSVQNGVVGVNILLDNVCVTIFNE